MRLRLGITLSLLLLATTIALGNTAVRETILDRPGDAPDVEVKLLQESRDLLILQMDLNHLTAEHVEIAGRDFSRLDISGASDQGAQGHPALPAISRLLQVPDGLGVTLRIVDMDTREFDTDPIAPVPPRDGEAIQVDETYYKRDLSHLQPSAEIGAPGVMRDLRVSPLVFHPVQYDPAAGKLIVAVSMTVEITFAPDGAGADVPAPKSAMSRTESFARFYENNVLNYDDADNKSLPEELGTYLMICRDNATVLSHVAPLVEWRQRQGYKVLLATTAETGTTTTSIKNYIQDIYDTEKPALEFVTLVGDIGGSYGIPTYIESDSGYSGRGDHTYTMLAGGDILPDIHLARLSFDDDNLTNLQQIVNKIVSYETAPPTGADPDWFTRGSLVGDPSSSGITCIYVNQWVRDQLLAHSYTEIDSLWSPNWSTMRTNYNKGATLMTYRGWLGMSGFSASYAENLTNTGELGFAVVMTCDSGSIEDDMSPSEAFVRNPAAGGVASIGTATIGTHTRYNNCMFTGVIDGAYNSGDYRVGPALTSGKLAMYNNYFLAEPTRTEIWMVWNNLIGDAATEIWTGFPDEFSVAYDATMDLGANSVFAEVTDTGSGLPVAGARVTLYKGTEIRLSAETDALGRVNLPMSGYTAGDLSITVSRHNYIPHLGTIVIGAPTDLVALESFLIDDTNWGNSDGQLNPGEHVQVGVQLHNHGTVTATSVSATISSSDPWVAIDAASANYGDIGPGADDWGNTMFEITLPQDAPAEYFVQIDLAVSSGGDTWHSLLEIEITGGSFLYLSHTFGGPGGDLDPGETGSLSVNLRNDGNAAIAGATATLISGSPWVAVNDAAGTYGAMTINGTDENTADPFDISVASDCFLGHLATFGVVLETSEGTRDTIEFQEQIGTASSTDPVGPDAYGYHAFDDTDTGYLYAPVYDWVEIDPTIGGSGLDLGLSDNGWEQDDTATILLPFDFVFYGETYDRVSICSNGWIAPGTTSLVNYRNWSLPTAGTPNGMICGFWDNLYEQAGTGGVFWWNDTANNRVIVEWSRMRNDAGGSNETFQIILYDPAVHETDSGDSIIEMMYNAVSQVDGTNGYATVGLQSPDHTDALLYTYWNQYPAAAASLTTGRALRFQTFAAIPKGRLEGNVTNASGGGSPVKDAQIAVLGSGRSFLTVTDGSYGGNVQPGTFDVIATHPSFAPDTTYNVVIVEDATTVVDFSLVDIAGPDFTNTTVLMGTSDTVGPYTIESTVTDYTGLDDVKFFYLTSAGGGLTELAPTDLGGGVYQAQIPGQPLDTRVRYFFTATDVLGQFSSEPAGGLENAYDFWVDDSFYYSANMETADGWTAGGPGDDAFAGIWTRVDPIGVWEGETPVQTEDDHTPPDGIHCWVTGNSETGQQGVDDVDGGQTTLLSPVFNLDGYSGLTFSYWRWYTNETGNNPGEDEWVVQVNDGSGWTDIERTTASNQSWVQISYPLSSYASATATVQFRFIAADNIGGGSVVEAGVDDFLLYNDLTPIDDEDPLVTVTGPLPGSVYSGGSLPTVEWTASDNVGVASTFIYYSADGGATWPYLVAEGALASPHSPSWAGVPDSEEALIKVVCFDAVLNVKADAMDGTFSLSVTTDVDEGSLPARAVLTQNHPNPFNPATEIRFALPTKQPITLKVYDVAGRSVATLAAGLHDAGSHTVIWRGEDDAGARVASGLYFYRLTMEDGAETRKMMLLK